MVILKPFNMNIIINKLDLPCDLKNEIHKYIYNSEGYTVDDLNAIKKQKNKKRNKFMKLRIKLELAEWYKYNVSVCWLRGRGAYGRKAPTSCWGGGTLYESQEFRFYNRNKKINDPDNDYIYKKLKQGDRRRNYI
jgi:hypothetical protein